jgi:hypothetical protein
LVRIPYDSFIRKLVRQMRGEQNRIEVRLKLLADCEWGVDITGTVHMTRCTPLFEWNGRSLTITLFKTDMGRRQRLIHSCAAYVQDKQYIIVDGGELYYSLDKKTTRSLEHVYAFIYNELPDLYSKLSIVVTKRLTSQDFSMN